MKFSKFFTLLAARILGKDARDPFKRRNVMRELTADPVLRNIAQNAGNARRLEAHRNACLTAYAHKRKLVKDGKGHHTLAGIPADMSPSLPVS